MGGAKKEEGKLNQENLSNASQTQLANVAGLGEESNAVSQHT